VKLLNTNTMFLTIDDYKPVCDTRELEILQQADTLTRERGEAAAIEEISSYLRTRYDINKAFKAVGDDRNPFLVQICVNVCLFYLVQWLPQRMSTEKREKLYDKAIKWCVNVQNGKSSPDLPLHTTGDDNTNGSFPMYTGGMERQTYDW